MSKAIWNYFFTQKAAQRWYIFLKFIIVFRWTKNPFHEKFGDATRLYIRCDVKGEDSVAKSYCPNQTQIWPGLPRFLDEDIPASLRVLQVISVVQTTASQALVFQVGAIHASSRVSHWSTEYIYRSKTISPPPPLKLISTLPFCASIHLSHTLSPLFSPSCVYFFKNTFSLNSPFIFPLSSKLSLFSCCPNHVSPKYHQPKFLSYGRGVFSKHGHIPGDRPGQG
jgi:hypothetical protein